MVAFDRYAYGIARSVHALPSFLAGNQFDVTTPLKPFPMLGEEKKGKFDSCHHNSVNLGVMLKIMPLNGMIFNMRSNFEKLEWHGSK